MVLLSPIQDSHADIKAEQKTSLQVSDLCCVLSSFLISL